MPPTTSNRERSGIDSSRSSLNPGTNVRPNTQRNGTSIILEDLQDIKDPLDGQRFLEKHSLLCPPGESPSHSSLAMCLHQILAMAGLQKPVINTICSVAFLLDEMEETCINETVKEAFDSQVTEFTSDMKLLVEDAKEKISEHLKTTEDHLAKLSAPPPAQLRHQPMTYLSTSPSPCVCQSQDHSKRGNQGQTILT